MLKRVADDTVRELRSGYTVGRFGGEAFAIVLPDATAQTTIMVAERVRLAIELGVSGPCVTIGVGAAELACGYVSGSPFRRADQALYFEKREGRNTLRHAL